MCNTDDMDITVYAKLLDGTSIRAKRATRAEGIRLAESICGAARIEVYDAYLGGYIWSYVRR